MLINSRLNNRGYGCKFCVEYGRSISLINDYHPSRETNTPDTNNRSQIKRYVNLKYPLVYQENKTYGVLERQRAKRA